MSAQAGNQYKTERVFGADEGTHIDADKKVECLNCHVIAVPRGLTSSRKASPSAPGHCPNCGHVHGRNSLIANRRIVSIAVTGAAGATTIAVDNGTLQMSAAILPAWADNKIVTWSVAPGTGTATISTAGVVTAVTNGTVTVTATANDGSGVTGTRVLTLSNQT